jgi:hypothetical protein
MAPSLPATNNRLVFAFQTACGRRRRFHLHHHDAARAPIQRIAGDDLCLSHAGPVPGAAGVFALEAGKYPGGDDPALVGLAMGIYGLTQGFLQIPFGVASDRFGRKRVMVIGLVIFAAGSVIWPPWRPPWRGW